MAWEVLGGSEECVEDTARLGPPVRNTNLGHLFERAEGMGIAGIGDVLNKLCKRAKTSGALILDFATSLL